MIVVVFVCVVNVQISQIANEQQPDVTLHQWKSAIEPEMKHIFTADVELLTH